MKITKLNSSLNVCQYFNVFEKKKEQQAVIKTLSAQTTDTPLTGAAFTHFIAFSKKAGTIVTCDLLPRWDGSNHFNTSDILLTRDELGGWKNSKRQRQRLVSSWDTKDRAGNRRGSVLLYLKCNFQYAEFQHTVNLPRLCK